MTADFTERWDDAKRGIPTPPPGMFDDEPPVDIYDAQPGPAPKPKPSTNVVPSRGGQDEQPALTFQFLDIPAIMEPLAPIKWVQKDLYLCPGRPTLWQGYGYSGKTITLQSLAMSLAWGVPIWGNWGVPEPKRVVHLDYEQGEYATRLRYQRLAFAAGVNTPPDPEMLRLACMPDVYLTSQGVEDFLCRELEGVELAIWDSLRAIVPGIDENDSVIRKYLDVWTRVSLKTGCAVIAIHHAGKGSKEKDKREQGRGSSAIFDACGTVFTLQGTEVGEPIKVSCAKTAAEARGAACEDFYLQISDVPNDDATDMYAGLRVSHLLKEQVETGDIAAPAQRIKTAADKIVTFLRRTPGGASATFIRNADICDKNLVTAAVELLASERRIECARRSGRGGGTVWTLTDGFGRDE